MNSFYSIQTSALHIGEKTDQDETLEDSESAGLRPCLSSGCKPSWCLPHADASRASLPAVQMQASFVPSMRGCKPRLHGLAAEFPGLPSPPMTLMLIERKEEISQADQGLSDERIEEKDAMLSRPCGRTSMPTGQTGAREYSYEMLQGSVQHGQKSCIFPVGKVRKKFTKIMTEKNFMTKDLTKTKEVSSSPKNYAAERRRSSQKLSPIGIGKRRTS